MYKLHDFECVCGNRQEELCDVPPSMMSVMYRKCGNLMEHVVIGGKSHVFRPFWHPHLGHTPVFIDSWRSYKKELTQRNLASPLGS